MLPHDTIWVGLRVYDGTNTNYQWLDGTLLTDTSMWYPGQPNHDSHACVNIHPDNLLADWLCSVPFSFLCEVETGKLDFWLSYRAIISYIDLLDYVHEVMTIVGN